MVLFSIAPFRPAAGLKCCSVKSLAIAAGSLMMVFAFFEMLAFVLVIVIEKELDGGECCRMYLLVYAGFCFVCYSSG